MGKLIDGKAVAAAVCEGLKSRVAALSAAGVVPCIALIKANDDAASAIYVSKKEVLAKSIGIKSRVYEVPTASQAELEALIGELNEDLTVHAILLQLPVAEGLDAKRLIELISPEKDADGITPANQARLFAGEDCVVPCTPQGVLHLIRTVQPDIAGMHAVVLGRSMIVGRPMISLLLNNDCSVTALHSKSRNIAECVREADIIVSAIGKPKFITREFVKPGAIVIDVGINRVELPDGKRKIVGDVDFDDVWDTVGAITPVPGGVGPMTVAYLMKNTVMLAERNT